MVIFWGKKLYIYTKPLKFALALWYLYTLNEFSTVSYNCHIINEKKNLMGRYIIMKISEIHRGQKWNWNNEEIKQVEVSITASGSPRVTIHD